MEITIRVSPGELLDKITILEIKSARVDDADKLRNIRYELELLEQSWQGMTQDEAALNELHHELRAINEILWDIEDQIRALEAAKTFDQHFVELARRVYITNDRRAGVKRRVNELLGSDIVEEKHYVKYD